MKTFMRVAVATAIAALLLSGCSLDGSLIRTDASASDEASSSASASAEPTTGPSEDPSLDPGDEQDEDLAVDASSFAWGYPDRYIELVESFGYDKFDSYAGDKFPTFEIGATMSGRVWTDAFRPPLFSQSIEAVEMGVLTDPFYGCQVGSGLATQEILLDQNLWLEEFSDISECNDWAAGAMNGTDVQRLDSAKKLALIVAVLERLTAWKIADGTTIINYHVMVDGPGGITIVSDKYGPDGSIPEAELNPVQYTGQFILLAITQKGQPVNGCEFIGFNVGTDGKDGDGRFAIVNICPPSSTPECLTSCGGTGKNHLLDPEIQGHNRPGGGGQAPIVTQGPSGPGGGETGQAYVAPTTPAAGSPEGSTLTDEKATTNDEGGGLS